MRTVEEVHEDICRRHSKAPSRFSHFFLQWIKFNDHSDRLYEARGEAGETYLQYRLSLNNVDEAAVVFDRAILHWRENGQEERVFTYLNAEDKDGNGIWHYLADTLRMHEGAATLKIARTLLSMDFDFSRRNKYGLSPLGKLLVPSPKWHSLNALIQTKHLTIENIEGAISEYCKEEKQRNHMMSMIFSSDIDENRALLSQHVLKQAVQPQADITLRSATCRLFFDYVDEEKGSTAFFNLIRIANHAMFDDLMKLLMQNAAETVGAMGAGDVVTRKAYGQVYLAKKLLRRDKIGEGVLFKCLFAEKHMHMRKISSLLHNDTLAIKVTVRGEQQRKDVPVEKDGPAPCNPLLSLLLQQDIDGNTVLHHSVLRNDLQALKGLMSGLASNDMYAIIKSFPNKAGLTLLTLTQPDIVRNRLAHAVPNRLIAPQRAKDMLLAANAIDKDMRDYLDGRIKEVEELALSVGRKEPMAPTFTVPKAGVK